MLLGSSCSYVHSYYYYRKYTNVVDECYEFVKAKFSQEPQLLGQAEDHDSSSNVVKNFGLNVWADRDSEDDWDITTAK